MTIKFQRQVDRSNRRGDTLGALVNTGLAFLFNGIREGKINTNMNPSFAAHPGQWRPPQAPPPVNKPDPFVVLGLDPKKATEKDVRRIQRGAAEMWHEDKGGGSQGHARLAEINCAAEACLKILRARKRAS
jgi:hypothetical protein